MSYVIASPIPITLGEGRTVAPGEAVGQIDPDHKTNRRHIEAGRLLEVKAKKAAKTAKEDDR